MIFYRRSCVVLTRPDNNYVQYLASNIPSGVQTTELLPAVQLAGSGVQSGLTVSESSWKCEIWRTIQLISGRQTVNNSQPWYLIFQTRRESGAATPHLSPIRFLKKFYLSWTRSKTFIFTWLDFFVTNIYLEIDVYQRIKIFGIFYGDLKLGSSWQGRNLSKLSCSGILSRLHL